MYLLMTDRKTSTAGISRVFVRFRLAPKEQLFCITWQFDRIFLAQSDLGFGSGLFVMIKELFYWMKHFS